MRARPALLVLLAALASGEALGAPPRDPAEAARALDAPLWEDRRRAEDDLVALGAAALEAPAPEQAALLAAWDAALSAAERDGGAGRAEAVARVLRRLEHGLPDDAVRRVPRLLRARVERHVALLVYPADPRGDAAFEGFDSDAWTVAALSVRALMPEARDALLEIVRTTRDPRRLAGAMVALTESVAADDEDLLSEIARAWDRDPGRLAEVARYVPAGARTPAATVALALALHGRAGDLPRLRRLLAYDVLGEFGTLLRGRLTARGDADLALGGFVERVEEGSASAPEEAEAARRAMEAGLPWLARLLARRARFLDATDASTRATLRAADEAIGLRATARRDAGLPPQDGVADDPDAAETDEALRAGRLSQRLLHRIEAGSDLGAGLVPVALGDRFFVVGTTRGKVLVVDAETGRERSAESTAVARVPRGLAVADGVVAAVTGRGGVFFWGVTPAGVRRLGMAPGPYLAVAAGPDGAFWFVGAHRSVWKADGPKEPVAVPGVAPVQGYLPASFAVLEDGALLFTGAGRVERVDPGTGAVTRLAEGDPALLRAAPYGRGAVVAKGERFEVLTASGEKQGGGSLPDFARITGVGGDAATGTVYVVTAESVVACAAKDGEVRWAEQVEGSGNPALGHGFLAVAAGLGAQEGGDNRLDRTVSVLRTSTSRLDPFAAEARVKAVEAAVVAARDGRMGVARSLLDPIVAWLTPSERWAADQAIREIPGREAGPPAPEDGAGK